MMKSLRACALILIASFAFIAMPSQAYAYTVLNCEDEGKVNADTELFFSDSEASQSSPSFCSFNEVGMNTRIFSSVICSYVTVLNSVMGKVYCGLQYTMKDLIGIVLTLYIAVFGAQILMGSTRVTTKEVLIRLTKLGLVWTFVSESNYAVDYVFIFFIDLANNGIWWALSALEQTSDFLKTNPHFANMNFNLKDMTDQGGVSAVMPMYLYIDDLIYKALTGPFVEANSKVIGFFSTMAFIMPPLFGLAAYWLWATFSILVRTVLGFMMSISAIAFLICLSPIFLCLMLFSVTYQFFDQWLKYLTSFSLQVVIVFACVAMWIMAMSNFIGFFNQLSDVIFPYYNAQAPTIGALSKAQGENQGGFREGVWGVCPYVTSKPAASDLTASGPQIKCYAEGFSTDAEIVGADVAKENTLKLIDLANIRQYTKTCDADNICTDETGENAIQTGLGRLIYFVIYHLVALTIIAYAFDALLKSAPLIAKEIAGPTHVPILGQGYGAGGVGTLKGIMKSSGDKDKPGIVGQVGNFITGGKFDGNGSSSTAFTDRSRQGTPRSDPN